jgi:hypothetical protein
VRAAVFTVRLVASVAALVTPVCRKPRTSGHQASMVPASRSSSRYSGVGAPVVEAEQLVGDVVSDAAGLGEGKELAEFLLGDPGTEDLAGRVVVDQAVPHL